MSPLVTQHNMQNALANGNIFFSEKDLLFG
jgi:hypothetical protein